MRASVVTLLARLILGGLYVFMGASKALEPVSFLKLVREYEVVASPVGLNLVAATLPWFEVLCGLLLLAGVAVRGTALVSFAMLVPFTVNDFIRRGSLVYGDRVGVIDEPDQPAASLGDLTYAQVAERARAMAAAMERLGIREGDRVAMVSHNSARLLTAFFGICGFGRILVPVNFRLSRDEVAYIVEHSGARVLFAGVPVC